MFQGLRDYHKANGGVFKSGGDDPMALHFGDPSGEYRSLEEGAVLFDLSGRGKIEISGEDRLSFLNGQVSNDIQRLRPGAGCLAAVLDHRSRILGDLRVLATEDALLADLEPEKVCAAVEGCPDRRFRAAHSLESPG
ncbi:MAG: hypothetical protein P8018_11820 [Acidobacteriota bacterium]